MPDSGLEPTGNHKNDKKLMYSTIYLEINCIPFDKNSTLKTELLCPSNV